MTARLVGSVRKALRWWRLRSLAAQLVLTNVFVVALWAATTRQLVSFQNGRREAAEQEALRAGAAVLIAMQAEPALVGLETGERGFALTGDSAFYTPYRLGLEQLDSVIDSLSKLSTGNGDLTRATSRLDHATRAWHDEATRHIAVRGRAPSAVASTAAARRLAVLMDSARIATLALER